MAAEVERIRDSYGRWASPKSYDFGYEIPTRVVVLGRLFRRRDTCMVAAPRSLLHNGARAFCRFASVEITPCHDSISLLYLQWCLPPPRTPPPGRLATIACRRCTRTRSSSSRRGTSGRYHLPAAMRSG